MAREGQGYPRWRRDMMMMMMIYNESVCLYFWVIDDLCGILQGCCCGGVDKYVYLSTEIVLKKDKYKSIAWWFIVYWATDCNRYISSSSSSSRATSMDIPDPLSPPLPIVHHLWQVFRATSAECMFELVVLLLPGHMWGSIIYNTYSHQRTDCFIVSQLFSVARHAQIYLRLSITRLSQQANNVKSGIIRHYVHIFSLPDTKVFNSFEEFCIMRVAAINSFARVLKPRGGAYIWQVLISW